MNFLPFTVNLKIIWLAQHIFMLTFWDVANDSPEHKVNENSYKEN